jgi:nucleoid DNA-binding protein
MEMVLDVYKRALEPQRPVVCMDESPKQLIAETRIPISASPGKPARHDYEYKRCGVCNIFLACEPLAGKRSVKITETKTKQDWAFFLEHIASQYQGAEKITLTGFGTFSKVRRKAREGRNPQTGETIKIKARNAVKFKSGKALKDAI